MSKTPRSSDVPPIFPKDELELLRRFFDQKAVPDGARVVRSAITAYEALAYSYSEALERIERDSAALLSSRSDAERLDWLLRGQSLTTTRRQPGDVCSLDYYVMCHARRGREDIDTMLAANRPSEEDDR